MKEIKGKSILVRVSARFELARDELSGDNCILHVTRSSDRGGEWYLERRRSRKILTGSRNLGSVFDKSRSLVFAWFVFTVFEFRNFLPKSLGLGFLTRVSASRRVSDFTIRHPFGSSGDLTPIKF